MTLIDYLGRVHFADGVLEEALWSELSDNGRRRPLIVSDPDHLDANDADRVYAGFPIRTSAEVYRSIPPIPTELAAREIGSRYEEAGCDILIAFGRSSAIDLAKAARVAIAHKSPFESLAYDHGGGRHIVSNLPELLVIPSIAGFGSTVSPFAPVITETGVRTLLMSRSLIPTTTIYDPTLTLGATAPASASAAVEAIANCVQALLADGYNPPADGIALDGLRRAVPNLQKVLTEDHIAVRREMMAASLNGSLVLQRGPGFIQIIANALEAATGRAVDPGALARLVLPRFLRFDGLLDDVKAAPLRDALGLKTDQTLSDGLEDLLSDLPLPRSLSQMGISESEIRVAAPEAARDLSVLPYRSPARADDVFALMEAIR